MSDTIETSAPVAWQFCPECGCETYREEDGIRFCTQCGQDWHSGIDYLDVVATNLRRLWAAPSVPVTVTEAMVAKAHKAVMSELFLICQPDNGNIFAFMDDHPEVIRAALAASIPQGEGLPTLTAEMARTITRAIDEYPYGQEVVDCRAQWIWRALGGPPFDAPLPE